MNNKESKTGKVINLKKRIDDDIYKKILNRGECQQCSSLKEENELLNKALDEQVAMTASYGLRIKAMEEENQRLKSDNSELAKTVRLRDEKYSIHRNRIKTLEEENESLQHENFLLKESRGMAEESNSQLTEQVKALEEALREVKYDLEDNYENMEYLVELIEQALNPTPKTEQEGNKI
jgi:chromosome segregation ATPase